jgi:uncharacterized membrane protein YhaH (DUF805 family)
MNFVEAIGSGFKNYVNFSGRAARSEFWYWTLFSYLVSVVAAILDAAIFASKAPFYIIAFLVLFLPGLSVTARRLHDLDKSAWWILMYFFVWGTFFWKGTTGPNRHGPDPL